MPFPLNSIASRQLGSPLPWQSMESLLLFFPLSCNSSRHFASTFEVVSALRIYFILRQSRGCSTEIIVRDCQVERKKNNNSGVIVRVPATVIAQLSTERG